MSLALSRALMCMLHKPVSTWEEIEWTRTTGGGTVGGPLSMWKRLPKKCQFINPRTTVSIGELVQLTACVKSYFCSLIRANMEPWHMSVQSVQSARSTTGAEYKAGRSSGRAVDEKMDVERRWLDGWWMMRWQVWLLGGRISIENGGLERACGRKGRGAPWSWDCLIVSTR